MVCDDVEPFMMLNYFRKNRLECPNNINNLYSPLRKLL